MYTFFSSWFENVNGLWHIFSYITARCGASLLLSFAIMLICMPRYIAFSHKWQKKGQPIRGNYLPEHLQKVGTPTMGGLIFIIPTLITCLFLILTNRISYTSNLGIVLLAALTLKEGTLCSVIIILSTIIFLIASFWAFTENYFIMCFSIYYNRKIIS